ncbi:hypothetical protein Thiowin_01185 [Thiorhodovibrio winogradskyi]|uniref:ATP-dependent DNA helicase RecG C-terminal domain-containing protein n=1 Tax=Thiorhodovibrio winogradskyi TaxID=77007 RepID=A0ABZ0S5H1_9GAMM|nr:hypothetical protein [Thiorhodovibrio winogradskyi]
MLTLGIGLVVSHPDAITRAMDSRFGFSVWNQREGSTVVGARTQPTDYCYSDKVFRELLVNACVHRNYAIHGSRIRVFLFSDRIEFISPGRLPNTLTGRSAWSRTSR